MFRFANAVAPDRALHRWPASPCGRPPRGAAGAAGRHRPDPGLARPDRAGGAKPAGTVCARSPSWRSGFRRCATRCATSSPISSRGSADIDARLKGLGPPPARDAPPEDAGIAAERARLTQQRAEVDAAIKQVQLLQTRADQLANALSDRRRIGLCGDAVPPLAERARSVLLARRDRGRARLCRASRPARPATGSPMRATRAVRARAGVRGAGDFRARGICVRAGALVAPPRFREPRRRAIRQCARRRWWCSRAARSPCRSRCSSCSSCSSSSS